MNLKAEDLCKSYPGKGMVLKNIDFELTEGIYGLLGPNGAGKTTLMNLLTTGMRQERGMITYDGKEISKMGKSYRQKIGYAPQQQWMYEDFRAVEYMHYFAALKGVPVREQKKRVEELLDWMNLSGVKNHKIRTFSGGMKQRLLLAQAMLNNPEILILDEPTAGLDPKERIRIRNLISEKSGRCIVLLATHVVQDVECIAKKILLLHKGELVRNDTPAALIRELDGMVYTVLASQEEAHRLQEQCMVSNMGWSGDGLEVRIIGESPVSLERRRVAVPSIEDVYLYHAGTENI